MYHLALFFGQGNAYSKSSLLLQIPSILAGSQQGGTTTVNDNVTVIDESGSAEIVSSNTNAEGDTELQLSGDLASSAQDGSILYLLPGADDRFPFGIAGKVVSTTSNTDGTKTVVLGEVTYADVVKKASFDMDNITLDASNFVGVIAPAAVEAASPMMATSSSDGSVYSFRNGAVVVRREADRSGAMYSAAEGGTIDVGTVSLNMKVDLAKMEPESNNMSAESEFIITGSLSNIKLTKEREFSLFKGGLKALDFHVDSDLNFDVKFNGNGSVKFGYFPESAWREVEEESIKALGVSAKLTGLESKDKKGKFPLAGLVFSVPCPPQKPCILGLGKTQTPLRLARAGGVILWVYLTAEGNFSLDGNLTLARLNPVKFSAGIKKPYGGDFQIIHSLNKKKSSDCLIEALKLDGTAGLQVQAGITMDMDFFASGVRLANAEVDIGGLFKAEATGEAGYCIENLGTSGSWKGEMCFSGGLGAGFIARAAAKVGIKIDTAWKDVSVDSTYKYAKQIPDEEDIDKEGRHGLWYYTSLFDTCEVPTVTSATGRVWMDRNLGASRVATRMDDEQAYGDLYQWGRFADGHEKRDSDTTSTLSSSNNPGHGKFILASEEPYDWRSPQNDDLWQGVNGVNNPCPSGFRLPTADEWQEEINFWSLSDAAGAFASPLKLVMGGRDGSFPLDGLCGYCWASTTDGEFAFILGYQNSGSGDHAFVSSSIRAEGFSVRCIKD